MNYIQTIFNIGLFNTCPHKLRATFKFMKLESLETHVKEFKNKNIF